MAFEHQSRQPRNRPGESPNGRREAGVWATCWGHPAVNIIATEANQLIASFLLQ